MTESSTQGIKTVLHPVSDLAAATLVYTALIGAPPQHESDYYGLRRRGPAHRPGRAAAAGDLARSIGRCRLSRRSWPRYACGRHRERGRADAGGGRLVATVTDPMATSSGCSRTDDPDTMSVTRTDAPVACCAVPTATT